MGPFLKPSSWFDYNALRDRDFMVYSIGVGFIYLAMYPALFHLSEWAAQEQFTGLDVVWCLALANGYVFRFFILPCCLWTSLKYNRIPSAKVFSRDRCGIIGRLVSALFGLLPSHRSNPLIPLSCACLLCAVSILLFWPFAKQQTQALAFCIILGMFLGLILGLPESGAAYLIPAESKTSLGAWTGTMRALCSVFALAGPLISGSLVKTWGLTVVGMLSGTSLIISAALFALVLWAKSSGRRRSAQGENHCAAVV